MAVRIDRNIDGNEVLKIIKQDDIVLNGDINSNTSVRLISETGSVSLLKDINSQANLLAVADLDITFQGEFNSESQTKLISKNGSVTVGRRGEKKNLNSNAIVSIKALGDVTFLHTDLNSNCSLSVTSRQGAFSLRGDVNSNTKLYVIAQNDIVIDGDINSNVKIELISTQGSIIINGHINSNAVVRLTAAANIRIAREIDGNLSVVARCEGTIDLNGKINNHAYVEFRGQQGIAIHGNISDHARVKCSVVDANIVIDGHVDDNASLLFWPDGRLVLHGSGTGTPSNWVTEFGPSRETGKEAFWWNNWFWSFGFLSEQVFKPNNYKALVRLVRLLTREKKIRLKAAGGSWSFSDIILPQDSEAEVNNVSIAARGKNATKDFRDILRHMEEQRDIPMDIYPYQVTKSLEHSLTYNESILRNKATAGIDLKTAPSRFKIIDTRNIAGSLQCFLKRKLARSHKRKLSWRYWVEAGITMTDFNKLLDHHIPRLAIEASGGSPGATLAGTISTATHGGEFNKPLLIDRVLAVHLIGPGGEEWWIEGSNAVIDKTDLQRLFPNITDSHFISEDSWRPADHDGITADDFLKAVVTSLGAIGILYSVVLEVVPQFSIHQASYKYLHWNDLLERAGVTRERLIAKDPDANETLLNFLQDGNLNGTGIGWEENQYLDLAINPIKLTSWVVNRKFIPLIAKDDKELDLLSNYLNAVSNALSEGAYVDGVAHSEALGRLLDFLSIPRDSLGEVLGAGNITNFLSGVSNSSMLLSSLMAHIQVKALWNQTHESDPMRGHRFLGDILDGVLDALQGTYEEPLSEISGLSYKVGAIGWPSTGLPGRGFEVAVPPYIAFSLINDILGFLAVKATANLVFLGYISVRLCPNTETLMGMQQFTPYSVMIEIVAQRTPEASEIFDGLIDFIKEYDGFKSGQFPPFHWGLETERINSEYLAKTPFHEIYRGGRSRKEVFKWVKEHIRNGHDVVFDNAFVGRMGL